MKKPNTPAVHETPGTGGSDDFAAMLASFGDQENKRLKNGDKVSGRVFHISKDNVFVEISATQEGVLARAEVLDDDGKDTVVVGDIVEAFVTSLDDGIVLTKKIGRHGGGGVEMLEQAREMRIPVEGTITAVNTGGVEVTIAGTRAFCPMGQLDVNFVEDPQQFLGKTLQFIVREVRERGRNVVVSRRALLEATRDEQATKLRQTLAVGQKLSGTVTRLAAFGAFVDLGGMDGLIPMSELSHQHVARAEDVFAVGDAVEVEVRSIEPDPKRTGQLRISLSRKATLDDPWSEHANALQAGASFSGRVVKNEAFGSFVELFPGIQGLVHISEMSFQRVRHPDDVVKPGDDVSVRLLSVDRDKRRLSLSMREASQDPRSASAPGAAVQAGAQVDGTVERVETYGVMVKLESGASALLPASETGSPRGSDLTRLFPVGQVLQLEVIGKDDRGRLRVSKTARERTEEQATLREYRNQTKASGFGTFADLLKKSKK